MHIDEACLRHHRHCGFAVKNKAPLAASTAKNPQEVLGVEDSAGAVVATALSKVMNFTEAISRKSYSIYY